MDELEVSKIRLTDGTAGPMVVLFLKDGRQMLPIPVGREFVREFRRLIVWITPSEEL